MRAFNIGFAVFFCIMLLIPLVFIDLSSDRVSVQENRMLAEHPKLIDLKNYQTRFIRQFDAWFKDSTGFREQLLALFNIYNKNVWFNGICYFDGRFVILVGEQGHHFNMGYNGRQIPKFQGKPILSGEELQNMADKLESIKTYFDKKNIPFTVMFCTDKETIYSEYFPKSIKRGPEPVPLDVMTNYIREHTNVDVFNIKDALLKEKDNYLLYPLIDTLAYSPEYLHYNQIGGYFAYRELMKHINRFLPEIVPFEFSDVDINYNAVGIPEVSLKAEKAYRKLDDSFFDDIGYIRSSGWFYEAFENTNEELPVILILHDSYALEGYMGKYLAQQFGKAIFVHYPNLGHIDKLVSRYKPDIVVFESAERQLEWFADCVIGIPELP